MNESTPSRWARIGAGFTRVRLIISNVFFFGFLILFLLMLITGGERIHVPDGGALVIDPAGRIVEQRTVVDPLERWLSPGGVEAETELQSVLDALERGATDDRIRLVVLNLDNLSGASTVHADAIGEALAAFRASGKEVIAYGSAYEQQSYLIASAADAIYMHPLGQLLLPGYRMERLYYHDLLERLKVNVHVFRAGKYKEFVEPYTRSDMSPEAREANADLVGLLWEHYTDRIVERRRLAPERFERYTQFLEQALEEVDGDLARLAVEYHLVDELLTPDQARARIADKVGYDDDGDYRGVGFEDYLRVAQPERPAADQGAAVAVITAEGPIVMTGTLRGMIAADALIELIRDARQDDAIGALVLRLDTPGGSSFASELIRQELELVQLAGKPVVVSMGPVAASGGYWIASTADAILAEPTTLTGSIGVFGIFPTFEDSLGAAGVRADGIGTSSIGSLSPLTPLSRSTSEVLQASTDSIYRRFVNLVVRGRDMPADDVDALAQGRVWLGTTAADRGLVDALGDRRAAIARAAELAKIETPVVRELRPPVSPGQLLLQQLSDSVVAPGQGWLGNSAFAPLLRQMNADWLLLGTLTDPGHLYALCGPCTAARGGPFGPW
jgi:protease-4